MSRLRQACRRFCAANKVFDPHPLSSNTSSSGFKNRDPIFDVLTRKIPILSEANSNLNILEIGSGKGMHINYFADQFRDKLSDYGIHVTWQPTDRNAEAFHVIQEHRTQYNTADIVKDPFVLDLNQMDHMIAVPDSTKYDMIFAINVFHVASQQCWEQFVRHSFYHLLNLDNANRMLLIYGAFNIDGEYTSESNEEFDSFMKDTGNNVDYYLKDVTEMRRFANDFCLDLTETIPMPSNNFCLVFQSQDHGHQAFCDVDF